jgi:ribosomal protein S6--L-glutamate ligase
VDISEEEAAMAVNAAKALGLNVAGVDLLRSSRGPLVLEVNSSPGLQGIETSTGMDIASLIIEYIEKNIKRLNYAG